MSDFNELAGPQQRRQMQLVESLNKAFGPVVQAEFKGERIRVEINGHAVWLNHEFRITGESMEGP